MMSSDDTDFTQFLNVDFDVKCPSGTSELVKILGKTIKVMHQTENFVSFELCGHYKDLEGCLKGFVKLVTKLDPKKRQLWDRCRRRTANIGIQAGSRPRSAAFPISQRTIVALAAIGCDVEVTVYAPPMTRNGASAAASS